MGAALIRLKRSKTRRVRAKAQNRRLSFGPVSLGFVTIILFSMMSLLYLAQSNQISTKGYLIKELEKKKQEIVSENERLQVEAARLQAVSMLSDKAKDLKMEQTKKIDYLTSFGSSLASKK